MTSPTADGVQARVVVVDVGEVVVVTLVVALVLVEEPETSMADLAFSPEILMAVSVTKK